MCRFFDKEISREKRAEKKTVAEVMRQLLGDVFTPDFLRKSGVCLMYRKRRSFTYWDCDGEIP
jgi:hypothetical protein